MAEMWDTELEEDVFVFFSSTLAVATGILCLHVQLHLLLLHREHQPRGAGKKVRVAWYVYGPVHHFWFPLGVMAIVFLTYFGVLLQQLESRRISDSLLYR
jgi:hypothetical protein